MLEMRRHIRSEKERLEVRRNVRSKKAIRSEMTIRSEKTIKKEMNRLEVKRPFEMRKRRLRDVRNKICVNASEVKDNHAFNELSCCYNAITHALKEGGNKLYSLVNRKLSQKEYEKETFYVACQRNLVLNNISSWLIVMKAQHD
ncbi:hypothetical protein Tco_0354996 [Tanacetum coccineum]